MTELVEHGIGGSKFAAPIARDLLTECQKRDPVTRRPASLAIPIQAAIAAGLVPSAGSGALGAGGAPGPEEVSD